MNIQKIIYEYDFKSPSTKQEYIHLLDIAIAMADDLNRQLDGMNVIFEKNDCNQLN